MPFYNLPSDKAAAASTEASAPAEAAETGEAAAKEEKARADLKQKSLSAAEKELEQAKQEAVGALVRSRELRANVELDAHSLELESEVQALRAEVQRLQEEAGSSKEPQQPETVEVLFALPGPLGLEFQAQQAPYIIAKIHDSGVATNLGINEGDELISVADEPVDHAFGRSQHAQVL